MTSIIESVLQSFALVAAAIATLRAGSRALYAVTHGQSLGIMDGPLILSPFDVKELDKCTQHHEQYEVSPLWEVVFGFSEAVRLLHNAHRNEVQLPRSVTMIRSSWSMESKQPIYMMSMPYSPYERNYDDGTDAKLESLLQIKDDATNIQDELEQNQSLVVLTTPGRKSTHPTTNKVIQNMKVAYTDFMARLKRLSTQTKQFLSLDIIQSVKRVDTTSSIYTKMDMDISAETLDYDTIYSALRHIPHCGVENFDDKNTTKIARIRAFAPQTFAKLRLLFGVKEDDFLKSILKTGPFVSFQSNSKGAARVGGFFFFTRDGAYMVKTIKKAEIKTILEMLPKYYTFMERNARRSLLTRFCGLYSVQLHELNGNSSDEPETEHVFLIMNSVFPAEGSKFISERFDLKGSTVGRKCSLEERQMKGNQAVLKDLDLTREVDVMKSFPTSFGFGDYGISIGASAKGALLAQLRRDLKLLVSCSVMDYSLLVGVVNLESADEKAKSNLPLKLEIRKVLNQMKSPQQRRLFNTAEFVTTPLRHLFAPAFCLLQIMYKTFMSTVSSVLTLPFPYYGAGVCGVDGGSLSVLPGKRLGNRAIYYMGVIDFLQPWTTQKVLEREFKGLMGYEKAAISCAHPTDYAERFLDYLDKHIT